ncbi:MAG TPA: class I SAM-dependent methyltransferase [Solirubrobacteraceae bacterium]
MAILGASAAAVSLAAYVRELASPDALVGIFEPDAGPNPGPPLRAWSELAATAPDVVAIATDSSKERLLRAAAAIFDSAGHLPRVILAGSAHQHYRDPLFEDLDRPALAASYATGHPSTRVHLYQVLQNASRHHLSGAVVELGAFKGGTTVWLAKAIRALGLRDTKVLGFDSWSGFPPRRSLLDLYEHPRCVFTDFDAVKSYTEPYGIELVCGDIAETAPRRLAAEPILLAFVDTDNYTGTRAALLAILPNLVHGGAIVFDHYWTTDDYLYTIGERMAGREVLADSELLNIHGTGVFIKVS